MAEIQQSTNSADLTQRFIEFILMQAQQAALCLGQIPHPSTGKAEINLDAARMFIDHLEIVKEKSRGNLNSDEEKILTNVLTELQLAYVHVAREKGEGTPLAENAEPSEPQIGASASEPSLAPSENDEDKKKFTKSYGA
jgi:hypothetical protein